MLCEVAPFVVQLFLFKLIYQTIRGHLACPFCRHQTSVTLGTIFDKTRTPLTTWFEAAWHVSTAKNGMSAKTLERTLGYNGLSARGFKHEITVQSSSDDPAHVSMLGVHRVSSLLKRWILGTHQGSVAPEHLQSYLEEFTFRFNRRKSRSRGLVFRRLLERAVSTGPVTERDVTNGYKWE